MEEERRQDPRTSVNWPVTIQTPKTVLSGEMKDFSIRGALILCQNLLELNEVFGMYVYAPHLDRPLELIVKVVWLNISGKEEEFTKQGMGVQFQYISPQIGELIEADPLPSLLH